MEKFPPLRTTLEWALLTLEHIEIERTNAMAKDRTLYRSRLFLEDDPLDDAVQEQKKNDRIEPDFENLAMESSPREDGGTAKMRPMHSVI